MTAISTHIKSTADVFRGNVYIVHRNVYLEKKKKRLENKKSVQSDRNSHIQKYIVLTVHKEDE